MAHKALIICARPCRRRLRRAARSTIRASPVPTGTSRDQILHVHPRPITGSRIEQVKCWTRAEWAGNGVDVDEDWAREGVRTIG